MVDDEQAEVVLVAERLEPTDNLIIVGVVVFVASDFSNLLQGVHDHQSGFGMMGKKRFKLIEQPAAKRHGLRRKVQIRRILRTKHLVQAFLDAGVVILKGEIQHLARMHVILPKGNSRRDMIAELRHEEGFSDFRRADKQISSGVEQTVDDGGFRGIGRVVEFCHGKRVQGVVIFPVLWYNVIGLFVL